jgi:YcxB-like protein
MLDLGGSLVTLHGTLTVDDLRRVHYYGMLNGPQAVGPVVLFLLAVGSIAAMVRWAPGFNTISIVLNASPIVVLFLFWCMAIVLMPLRSAKKAFRNEPGTYAFLPEEIRISHPSACSVLKWNVVTEVRETRSLFLLQLGKRSAIPVPKRFFASLAEIDAWKQLVLSAVVSQRVISQRGIVGRWC